MQIIVHGGIIGEWNFSVCAGHDLIKIASWGVLWLTYMFKFLYEGDM